MHDISPKLRRRIVDTCLLMESDLAYPHDIDSLAEYAGISRFHFQRGFKKVVGESAIAHLSRLRMSRAAMVLKNSDAAITQIAMEIGFSTHASFTHAFQRFYGCSPTEYREQQMLRPYMVLPTEGPLDVDEEALAKCPLTVQIRREPTRRIALMRHVGTTASLPTVWSEMLQWCRHRELLNEQSTLLGIHHDDWDDEDPDGYDGYRYDAAIVIDSNVKVDDAVNTTFIPGGEVAVVMFKGSIKQMESTWRTFAYDWLSASGYQPRLSYVYDTYDTQLAMNSTIGLVIKTLTGIKAELCIPISRKPLAISAPN